MIGLVGVALIVLGLVLFVSLTRLGRGHGPADAQELETLGAPDTPAARELIGRWRDRSRRWRTLAGLSTVVAVLALGVIVRGGVHLGIGGVPLWTDPLTMGLAAAFVGAIGAELHHLRRRPSGPRTVSLERREVADHLPTSARWRLAILVGTAGTAGIVHVAVPAVPGVPLPAAMALTVAAAVPLVQRAIVTRPRPQLPVDLSAADDAVRGLAIRSVDASGAGLMLLLLLWQISRMSAALDVGPGLVSLLAGLTYVAVTAIAVAWWWRGGPAALMSRPSPARQPA